MSFISSFFNSIRYIRHSDGSYWNQIYKGNTSFLDGGDVLNIALNNPVVAACIKIRSNFLSKVEFYQENEKGERITDSDDLFLINNPNEHQTKEDFLKQYEWYRLCYGWVYQIPYGSFGINNYKAIFNLNPQFIEFPEKIKSIIAWDKKDVLDFKTQKFKYIEQNERDKKVIEFGDVLMYFDIANGLIENPVISPSRIQSIIKPISNFDLGLDAENLIIKTNGRELFTNKLENGTFSEEIKPKDRKNIEDKLLNKYSLGDGGQRAVIADSNIQHKSLHIKLADLGFSESASKNANLITQVFEIPNEIYKAYKQGATFENHKEAVIDMYQNTIQPVADDIVKTWNNFFNIKNPIKASFSHLPVMQYTEQKKADKILKIALALEKLTNAGFDEKRINELFESQGVTIN